MPGWPIFLPWTAQALQFLMFFMIISSGGLSGGPAAMQAISSGSLLIGLADFVLVIALGCVKSRRIEADYAGVFGGEPVVRARPADAPWAPAPAPTMPTSYGIDPTEDRSTAHAREDAAIARALAAYRNGGVEPVPAPQAAPIPRTVPVAATPRVGGFGRKGL